MKDRPYNKFGSAKLLTAKIHSSSGKSINCQNIITNIDVYEDINYPVIRANVTIVDTIGLVKSLPIIGEEVFEVSFLSLFNNEPVTYKLSVYSIDGTESFGGNTGSAYILKCVSEEYYQNGAVTVNQAYNDISSNIVKDLLQRYLNTTKKLVIESTAGIQNIVIPKLTPFSAIDFIKQRSFTNRQTGGVYTFFENKKGFNFITLESLVEQGNKNQLITYTYSPTATTEDAEKIKYFNLVNFEHIAKFNTAEKINNRVFASKSRSFDLKDKSVNDGYYDIGQSRGKFATSDSDSYVTNSPSMVKRFQSPSHSTFFTIKDSHRQNDYRPDFLSYKLSYTTMFNQNIVRCQVYGDTNLTVGQSIKLNIPVNTSVNHGKGLNDLSGTYIITKLRHIITGGETPEYYISMDCNKVGVGK